MTAPTVSTMSEQELSTLARWMSENGLGTGPLTQVTPLGGGTQNIMVSFERDGTGYVVRRGPRNLRPGSNVAITREIRVLAALTRTAVPHPTLIAACSEPTVMSGAAFYLMEPIDGFNPALELPALHNSDAFLRRAMAFNLVDTLATLGAVDHERVGLSDFGKPAGFLERQVPRWLAELDSYRQFAGYDGPQIPEFVRVAAWLEKHRPTRWRPGILHGDFHCANAMFDRSSADVAAIVDWEMATVGDPLLDLGWLLATWQLPGAPSIFGGAYMQSSALPEPAELVARYAEQTERHLTAITWYVVLACFKLGIVLEGTYARACAGLAPRETGDALHTTTIRLFERAINLMDGD